jgi:predicted TIM-barrel fold metal-dependent hydrolase
MSARIIDTHHHIYPPHFTAANLKRIVEDATNLPATAYLNWSPRVSLAQMDEAEVQTAICSMTSPGVWFGNNEESRVWARECNEFGAGMARDFPGRFGMFAALPLPDTDGSLAELAHALDVLRLDGIGLLTSYAGRLLGDPGFVPVMQELNRRKAVVFVHPTMSTCCGSTIPNISNPPIEFPTDTTRTITSLIYSGTFALCPDIRFIFSHGGGTMPMLLQRIGGAARRMPPEQARAILPNGLEHEMKRQHYDLASIATNPVGMAAVFKLIPVSQLLWGADAPFGSMTQIGAAVNSFELPPAEIAAIQRGNALRLFPRYAP